MSAGKSYFDLETFLSVFAAVLLAGAILKLTGHLIESAGKNFLGE
jgi:hypothetical protein